MRVVCQWRWYQRLLCRQIIQEKVKTKCSTTKAKFTNCVGFLLLQGIAFVLLRKFYLEENNIDCNCMRRCYFKLIVWAWGHKSTLLTKNVKKWMNGRFDSFKIRCCEITKQIEREAKLSHVNCGLTKVHFLQVLLRMNDQLWWVFSGSF